ncbi:MAG: DUF3592 domain-containing protein [bacterium]|nr:DUF3592 domain-containing protein [bacterium]
MSFNGEMPAALINGSVALMIGVLLALIDVFMLRALLRHRAKFTRIMRTYQRGEARITEAGVGTIQVEYDDGETRTQYTPTLRYQYVVNGERYTGERLTFNHALDWSYRTAEQAAAVIESRFRVGSMVPLFYHPRDPQQAALIVRVPSLAGIGVVAATFALVTVALLAFAAAQLTTPEAAAAIATLM